MKIAATIQARTGSSRLPGKVLRHICGKPMLALQVERIAQSMLIDEIIICTTVEEQDDPIAELAQQLGVSCHRGSEDDVLGRITGALRNFAVDVNVEFMGDSPLVDPMLVDSVIGFYLKNADRYDYVSNALKTTYPPGAEVYVYPSRSLLDAERHVEDESLREHVGIHIYQNPDRYRLHCIEASPWYHYPELYLEVDTAADFEVMTAIFEHFYPHNPGFTLSQVIEFMLANPELASRNQAEERRWKAFRKDS